MELWSPVIKYEPLATRYYWLPGFLLASWSIADLTGQATGTPRYRVGWFLRNFVPFCGYGGGGIWERRVMLATSHLLPATFPSYLLAFTLPRRSGWPGLALVMNGARR